MRKALVVLIVVSVIGCGSIYRSTVKGPEEPSAYEQTVRGDELLDPGRSRVKRDLLIQYRQAIADNANELLVRSDPGNDLFHVSEVQIESVFLGDPSIVGARVSGVVDRDYEQWSLMHPDGDKAEFTAHYLFGPKGDYRGIRNLDLVRVWN